MIEASDFADRTLSDERKDPGFYRLEIPGRTYEHTLFTDSELLQQYAADKGWTTPPRYRGWQWSDRPPRLAQRARSITIPYSAEYSDVTYQYDPALGAYRRSIVGRAACGRPDRRTTGGRQRGGALRQPCADADRGGCAGIQIGGDPAVGSRDACSYSATARCRRGCGCGQQREDPLLFVDEAMQPLELKPGNVWIQIVPLDMDVASAP